MKKTPVLLPLILAAVVAQGTRGSAAAAAVAPALQTPAAAISQPPAAIPIADLVTQTVAQNPEIQFYENEIRFARERHSVSARWADPELSVDIGRKSVRAADGRSAGDGLAWGVTLAQKFDFSGRAPLRKAIALRQVERAQAGLAQFRRELAARAAGLGYTLLAAQQRLDAAEEVVARGRAMLATLVQRDPAGVAMQLEIHIVKAAILKLERDAVVQRAELLTALADLNMLRGLAPGTPLRLANENTRFAPAPQDSRLFAIALRDNFMLRQFELDLQEQGLAVDLERKNARGDVTIAPYYNEAHPGDVERTAGLGVSVPLPLWNANKAAIALARTRKGQAENALFKTRRDLRHNIVAASRNYHANQSLLAEWDADTVAQFRESAELGDRSYLMGVIPVNTYLTLQQAYLDMMETVTTMRTDAIMAAAQLTILTGLPIDSFIQKTEKDEGGAQ